MHASETETVRHGIISTWLAPTCRRAGQAQERFRWVLGTTWASPGTCTESCWSVTNSFDIFTNALCGAYTPAEHPTRMMSTRLLVIGALVAASLAAAQPAEASEAEAAGEEERGQWIEHWDKASAKKFYYHSVTRKTAWEAPVGAKVVYMDETGGGSGGQGGGRSSKGAGSGAVALGLLVPIVLPILGLGLCYWQASKEGLSDVLKELRKKGDRVRKRRGAKAGSGFRHRQKLSQDGKGGRSANS